MTQSIRLRKAPIGFLPNVQTRHDEVENKTIQTFPGGRVEFILSKENSEGIAKVDGHVVGTWKDLTVGQWSDILYTLTKDFRKEIGG